jgi:hypothetical protein
MALFCFSHVLAWGLTPFCRLRGWLMSIRFPVPSAIFVPDEVDDKPEKGLKTMRRFVSPCIIPILVVLFACANFFATAQTIKVKNIGRSLNSLTAPVKGATAPPWNISTGLKAVGIQSRAYVEVDTAGSGQTGAPAWTIVSAPNGSTATLDSTGTLINSIMIDLGGQYIFSATVGAQTAYDTVFASTYAGVGTDAMAGCVCHTTTASAIKTTWEKSPHAKIFKDGVEGNLEVERGKGAYAASCIKCHTTGWDPNANNNNFGYQVHATGWDTSWYKGLEFLSNDYWITTGDTTIYASLSPSQQTLATIGCESCHGPAADHKMTADKNKIGKSLDADVCNQCHDGARRHSLGTFYNLSIHATVPAGDASEGGRSSCQPCHTGKGFLYYLDHNKDTTGLAATWKTSTDAGTPISCQVCHDPHGNDNPYQLRTVSVKGDSLRNGYILPANLRTGPGLLCANCHSSRYSVNATVKVNNPPYYGFKSRFGPHENPQADMFYGSNGYQFDDTTFTGLGTHQGLEGTCVHCHMQPRMNRLDGSGNMIPNHSFSMTDTTFGTGVYKPTDVCASCHGEIDDFNQVKAFYDYDRNGRIDGIETEVQGLLDQLKAILPKDNSGEVIGSGSVTAADSAKIQGRLDLVAGIWNYRFVEADGSMGAHNAKYAVRLLYKSLGWIPLFVKDVPGTPTDYALDQNYPNPFNPSTVIRFSLPTEQQVKLEVYDITGALVKTILNEAVRAGNKEVTWDGTNYAGARVASGMYFYRLQAGSFVATRKMLLLK